MATGVAGLAGLLAAWQIAAVILGDQVALPSVSQTVGQFTHYLGRPYPAQGKPLWFDLYISLRRILIGFLVGVTIGVALGAAMSASRVARHLVDPVIEVIRPLPPLAFIPLFIVWLGIGELPKEVLIIVGVIPVMAVTTVAALDEVPEDLRLCARTLGATSRYALLHVQIRSALPGILTGMRICHGGRVEQHRRGRTARRHQRPRVHDHAGRGLPQHGPRLRRDHHDRHGRPNPRRLPARAAHPGRPQQEALSRQGPRDRAPGARS